MRLLAISALPPLPLNHATRRIVWNFLTRLPFEVHLLTWESDDTSPEDLEEMAERLPLATVLPRRPAPMSRPRRTARQARFLAGSWPPFVQAMLDERDLSDPAGRRRFSALVADLHREAPFDAVLYMEESMKAVPVPLLQVPILLQRHNLLTEVLRGQRQSSFAARAYWQVERSAWDRYDTKVMAGVSKAIANTEVLADRIQDRYPEIPIHVVHTGTDMRQAPTLPSAGFDVAFVGWMSYEPNVMAATHFAQALWPEIRRRHPQATLRIIGKDPVDAVRQLQRPGSGIVVTGEVPDVVDAVDGCRAVVVPLRRGLGLKTKTIEGLAMGLPTITFPTGAEGLQATASDGLLRADTDQEMIDHVDTVMNDGELADRLGQAGRRWVMKHHGWDPLAARYAEIIGAVG